MLLQHYICFCVYFSAEITLTILRILKNFEMLEDDSMTLRNLKRDDAERSHVNFWLSSTPRFLGVLSGFLIGIQTPVLLQILC